MVFLLRTFVGEGLVPSRVTNTSIRVITPGGAQGPSLQRIVMSLGSLSSVANVQNRVFSYRNLIETLSNTERAGEASRAFVLCKWNQINSSCPRSI